MVDSYESPIDYLKKLIEKVKDEEPLFIPRSKEEAEQAAKVKSTGDPEKWGKFVREKNEKLAERDNERS